jgi:hypothetical protein
VDAYTASKYATRQREVLEVLARRNLKGAFTPEESRDDQEVGNLFPIFHAAR